MKHLLLMTQKLRKPTEEVKNEDTPAEEEESKVETPLKKL